VLGGARRTGGRVELPRKRTIFRCVEPHRPHDGIAARQGEPRQFGPIGRRLGGTEPLPEARIFRREAHVRPAVQRLREFEIKLRGCKGREEPGAAPVVTITSVAAQGRRVSAWTVAVDGVACLEKLLERGQGRLSFRIEHAVRATDAPGMKHPEHHGDVEPRGGLVGCASLLRPIET